MLPKYWRLRMINETGQTMTFDGDSHAARIAIRVSPWKFTSGAKVDGDPIVEDLGFGASDTIVDDGEVEGTVVDNTSDLFLGATGTFEVTHNLDAASGQCRLFFEHCDDDSSWPSDADDFVITDLTQIAVLPMDPSAANKSRSVNFVL